MDGALAAQLVTVGATLGGVVLTLTGSALVERRRAREARHLESFRLTAEHAKWLREERMKAYAALSLAAEDVFHFLRTDFPTDGGLSVRWSELRNDLRKTYNQVVLLGAEEPRKAALRLWRVARNDVNDLLRDISAGAVTPAETNTRLSDVLARIGDETNDFLKSCRTDLQSGLA